MASCWKTPGFLLIVTLLGARAGAAVEAADALSEKLMAVEEKLTQTKSTSRQDPINYPGQLDNQLVYLYGSIEEQDDKPTDSARTRFTYLSKELDALLGQLREVVDSDVPAFNDLVERKGATAIFVSGF